MTDQPALSAAEIEELRELHADAEQGEWVYNMGSSAEVECNGVPIITSDYGILDARDARYLVAAANAVPRLIDQFAASEQARERAEQERDALRAAVQWTGGFAESAAFEALQLAADRARASSGYDPAVVYENAIRVLRAALGEPAEPLIDPGWRWKADRPIPLADDPAPVADAGEGGRG